jgi:antitoxin component YwqK of YwqJK toxin-antitoxin module
MSREDGYRPDQLVSEGYYVQNKREGIWKKYYPNGNTRSEITYRNNLPRGPYKVYYPNGKLEEEGTWEGNKNTGLFRRYHENGSLAQEFTFTAAGKRDGVQRYFYENGRVQLQVEVQDGIAHGLYQAFSKDGELVEDKRITNGKIDSTLTVPASLTDEELAKMSIPDVPEIEKVQASKEPQNVHPFEQSGYNTLYNQNKQITQVGEFREGRLWNGKWHRYDVQGKLKKIEVYQEGRFVGYAPMEE